MINQIKLNLAEAFVKIKDEYGIPMQDSRVQIKKNGVRLQYLVLNKTELVATTSLDKLIGGKNSIIAGMPLYSSVKKLFYENGLDYNSASLLLYMTPENIPSGYLYNNKKAIKQVEIENLLT